MYSFVFDNVLTTPDAFKTTVIEINELFIIPELVLPSKKRNLAGNLVQWMSWRLSIELNGYIQFFSLKGRAFDIIVPTGGINGIRGFILSEFGLCTGFSGFSDAANWGMEIDIHYDDYLSSDACVKAVNPKFVASSRDYLHFEIEIRSFSLAIGIASNTIFFSGKCLDFGATPKDPICLVYINSTSHTVASSGESYTIYSFTDPLYESSGSRLTFCTTVKGFWMCTLSIGNFLALPIFNHRGYDLNNPSFCNW